MISRSWSHHQGVWFRFGRDERFVRLDLRKSARLDDFEKATRAVDSDDSPRFADDLRHVR